MINNVTVHPNILFFAFRYALGRYTAASSIVYDNIKLNMHLLSDRDKEQMIEEIRDYLNGWSIDDEEPPCASTWISLINLLQT